MDNKASALCLPLLINGPACLGEVIAFDEGKTAFSPHFILTTGNAGDEGWYAGVDSVPIVIESLSNNTVITALDAVISGGGEYYSVADYSRGKKVETGSVEDGSAVHVRNINMTQLEINCQGGEYFALNKITVYYTHIHDFSGAARDNGDGTHSFKCKFCDEYGDTSGHLLSEATCTIPEFCLECEYEGDPLGHLLGSPDCTVPVICVRCHNQIAITF